MSNLRIAPITKKKKEQEELRITPILTEEQKKQQAMSQSKVMTHEPAPQVKMTIDSINNKINTNINQKIISGGIENEIHNMNMKNIGRTSLDKNIDLSGKSVMGKTTPVDTSDFIYNDTGKKYGDYFYQDYEKRKDEKIYKKGDNYFLYNDKLKIYEPIENINFMTTKEADEEEYKKAKELGYKGTNKNKSDKQAYKNTVLSLSDRLDLDTRNLSKNKYKEYEEDLLRQQKAKDEEKHIINYGSDGTLIGGLKSFKSLGENFGKNVDKEIIYPIKHIKENYEVGKKNNEISLQYYNKMMGKTNNADELAREKEQFDYFNKDLINNPGWVGTAIQNANTQIESLKHQGITATLTGGAGALIGTVVNPGGGTVAGAKIGGSIGYTLGSVPYTYKLEAGNQYKELTDMGVPHSIAKKHSQRVGVINAAIESGENIVDLIAFKTASGTKVIPKESITDLIDEYGEKEVKSWFREKLGEKTSDAIMTFAKSYGQNIWSESLEEMAQETTSIAGERLSTKEAGIDRNVSLEKDIIRVLKAGESAAISTAFTGPISSLGGTIATNTLNHIETKIENKVVSSKDINETLSNEIMKSNKLISDEEIQNIQKEVYQELKEKNVKIINDDENTSNLPNNSNVEQRNINNNINNQVNENVENSMDTMQNNSISENINIQQNNQLENLIKPQNINYSKNVNDRIDLEDYDFKTEQVIKSAERNVIVRNYRQLDTLIDEALDTQSNKALHFGRINETITQRIKRKLENLPKMKAPYLTKEKYDLVMNQSEIRHLIDEKAMMTREDVHKYVRVLPEIISNFDSASYSIEPDSEGIRFKKKLPDGNYISFVLVSNKQSTLKAKSIHLDKNDYETKKRSISPTNDVLKTPDRTSETDGAFASMKELAQTRVQFPTSPNSLNEQVIPTDKIENQSVNRFVEQPVSNNDNTTNSPKSQIAPLPQYNMQQNTKNDTTKIKPPIAKEYQKNTIEEKIEKSDNVIRVQAEEIANQLNSGKPLNTKERRWIETSTESDILKGKVFKDDLDIHKINYEVQSNKKSLKEANNKLDMLGYEGSIKNIKNLIDDGRVPTASDVALAQRTLQEAAKRGDTEIAQNLVMDVAILGTELGQATQALSMINKLTPEGQLKLYSKIVHRAKLMGDKSFQDVEITPEMVEMILNAYDKNGNFDQNDLNARVEKFKQEIADQLKSSVEEKIDAWRYLAMLGNPKTHIRNIVSNIAMKYTVKFKNAIARSIETVALREKPINTRTKTWKKSSEVVKEYARNTATEMKNVITGESKYGEKASLESKKRIFKLAPLEAMSNFNSNLLEAEDWYFSKSAFINTFEEYLTANGIKTMEDIKNNPEIVEKGKEYSVKQAEIATFRQYSKLANWINKAERNSKFLKYPIKATMPFKKTPINVAKTGLSYSPAALLFRTPYDIYQLKKGNINASQFIDNLSQSISGNSLALIGYALSKAGILTGAIGNDKDDKYLSDLGKQGYSIKIGNKYYSLSWLSPVAMPLFVGANFHEQLEEREGWDMNVLSDALAKTLDPLSEMSFVSSLTDALNSYGETNDKIKGMLESVGQSYVGQFFPTLFSQFASVGDDTKRSTKVSGNSSYKFGEQTVRSIMYKIPGLRNQLEPSTDIWGKEIKQNENIVMRALESFILPYNAKEYKNSNIDKELLTVYRKVGKSEIIPGFPRNYVQYHDKRYNMSAKEYTKYKKTYGTSASTMFNMLMNTSNYKNSTDKRKTRMIEKIYNYSRDIAKEEFLSNRKIDYDIKDFKYDKKDYQRIVNYITSNTQYKDDD